MSSSTSSLEDIKHKNIMFSSRIPPLFMSKQSSQQTTKTTDNNKNLSKVIRQLVWNKYIGERNGLGKCWCCRNKTISAFEFEAGHVIARANGGEDTVENLRPICSLCNKSMGKENMIEYQKRQNLGPTASETLWENFLNIVSYIPLRFGW